MTAVATLTHVWGMVDHKPPKQLKRSPKLKAWPGTDFSISVFNSVGLHLLSKKYFEQAILSIIFTQSQPFNEMFIFFNGKLHYCNNTSWRPP